MANRFTTPIEQLFLNSGIKNAGGSLTFYLTGTSTPAATYYTHTRDPGTENQNPMPLDDAGRPEEEIFLDPNVTYKVVYKDINGVEIWTADPYVDPSANVTASFQVYPGDPNGNVAGNQGTPGGGGASVVWDITNNLIYVCTTTGDAATAVWISSTASLAGAVVRSGIITPSSLGGSPAFDAYNPTGFAGASQVRQDLSADVTILDFPAGVNGQEMRFRNISASNYITFARENGTSTAARRLSMQGPITIGPGQTADWSYDNLSSRWFLTAYTGANGRTVLTDAATVAWDLSTGRDFEVTLTAGRTLGAFTNGTPGMEGRFFVKQNGTGNFALDLSNAVYDFWGPSIENIARGANEETEYAYKVVSATSMLLRRIGATSIASGGRDLLAVVTASSSATIDFVLTKWLSLYDRFEIDLENVQAATDNTALRLRTSSDGGSSYDSGVTNYQYNWLRQFVIGTDGTGSTGDSEIEIISNNASAGMSSVAGETAAGRIVLHSPAVAQRFKVDWNVTLIPADEPTFQIVNYCGMGFRDAAADVDAVRLSASSGNIASGSFRLYGIRK